MKKYKIFKLIGLSFLIMIVIVILLVAEVVFYSLLVNPGKPNLFYEEHAKLSLPWIAGIAGFFIFFFVVKYWAKKHYQNLWGLALLFPLIYIALDFMVLMASGTRIEDFYLSFIPASLAKIAGSLAGYYFFKAKTVTNREVEFQVSSAKKV